MLKHRKVYDYITKSWVVRPFETDPSKVEIGTPSIEQLKACGLLKGYPVKSFSEMTPEEQKLFIEYEEEELLQNSYIQNKITI